MKGWSIIGSLIYSFVFLNLFYKNKTDNVEPDITISLVILSNKWWEV